MRSRRSDEEALLGLIELAYAAAEDPRHWQPFLLGLAESLLAKSAHLLHHDLTSRGSVLTSVGLDPEAMRLYNDHFHHVDPFALSPVARTAVAGVCATEETFIPRADLIRSEYYNDFAVRFDNTRLMSVLLEKEGSVASALTILRGRRNQQFDARDQPFLRAFAADRGSALERVRRQTKQIFAKTGTRHRGELVRLLSAMPTIPSR